MFYFFSNYILIHVENCKQIYLSCIYLNKHSTKKCKRCLISCTIELLRGKVSELSDAHLYNFFFLCSLDFQFYQVIYIVHLILRVQVCVQRFNNNDNSSDQSHATGLEAIIVMKIGHSVLLCAEFIHAFFCTIPLYYQK